jgi:hypothetical protein
VEARLDRFRAANTQVLGVSVDSVHCHANWARDIGGISFPLLADFHPKGDLARKLDLYLDREGTTDRATVIATSDGIIRHVSSVTPSGKRDIDELVALCEEIDGESEAPVQPFATPAGLPADARLYVKDGCEFSRTVIVARDNLHLRDSLPLRNISEDEASASDLRRVSGKTQVPCLVHDGQPMLESKDIIAHLVRQTAPI